MPGWQRPTAGITDADALPAAAKAYVERLAELVRTPIHIVSTGPDRDANIVYQRPFA